MPRTITSATTLENLRKEAKRWLKALRAGDADARTRFDAAHPKTPAEPTLRDVQHALALEYEATDWAALKRVLTESARQPGDASLRTAAEYEALAEDWVRASDEQDAAAIGRLNAYYHRTFTADDVAAEIWRRVYGYPSTLVARAEELPRARRSADPAGAGRRLQQLAGAAGGGRHWRVAVSPHTTSTKRNDGSPHDGTLATATGTG